MSHDRRFAMILAAWTMAAAGAAQAGPVAATGPDGIGTDLAGVQQCTACHDAVGTAWGHLNSHSLLLDCRTCHKVTGASGKGHAETPACSTCHSQKSHPTAATACNACHDAHGTVNAFLVRDSVTLASGTVATLHVTKPEGAGKDGLVRAGVSGQVAGTGVCEVCHETTTVYNHAGTGAAHGTQWCAECHRHEDGYTIATTAAPAKAKR